MPLTVEIAARNNSPVHAMRMKRKAIYANRIIAGLKVEALSRSLQARLRAGKVNLDDPATTLALLKLDSVVGVTGFFDEAGRIKSVPKAVSNRDGRFATLADVVNHYNGHLNRGLSDAEKSELVEYLKSFVNRTQSLF